MPDLPFRGLIFDLDGTLADSLDDIADAMNVALARFGLAPRTLDEYRRMVGEGVDILTRRAVPADAKVAVKEVADAFRTAYAEAGYPKTRAYPGIPALLDALAARNVPMAVLSNKRDDFTQEVVRRRFGSWAFVDVRGERAGVPRKPDPTSALDVAKSLGIPPGELAFVGDTAIDMKTARAAGMTPIGVLWGFRGKDELVSNGAMHLLSRPEELLALEAA